MKTKCERCNGTGQHAAGFGGGICDCDTCCGRGYLGDDRPPRKKPAFPRIMWADYDPTDKRTPVAVYKTRADQRGNRPDLKPIRVLVTALSSPNNPAQTREPLTPESTK